MMFREIIEDAHSKYNISQEDIQEMCRESVSRAAVLLEAMNDPDMFKALIMYGYDTDRWDALDPKRSERARKTLHQVADGIAKTEKIKK